MEETIVQSAPNSSIEKITLNGEEIYLKKNTFFPGYRIVYPVKDNQKYVWPNLLFGGWANLFKLAFILLVIILAIMGYSEINNQLIECQKGLNYLPKI